MALVTSTEIIIRALATFMQENHLGDMNGSFRNGVWKDFCIKLNKVSNFNEQSRLSYEWNKAESSLKKKVLDILKLETRSQNLSLERLIKITFSKVEWFNFVEKMTNI